MTALLFLTSIYARLQEIPMAYIVQPFVDLFYVDDSLVTLYVTAGWVQATAAQITTWQQNDPYVGQQSAPPAPPLISPTQAPAPIGKAAIERPEKAHSGSAKKSGARPQRKKGTGSDDAARPRHVIHA